MSQRCVIVEVNAAFLHDALGLPMGVRITDLERKPGLGTYPAVLLRLESIQFDVVIQGDNIPVVDLMQIPGEMQVRVKQGHNVLV